MECFQKLNSFSRLELEKKFYLKDFLNQFSVSHKNLRKLKKERIDLLARLKDHQFIEDQFSLTSKDGSSLMLPKSEYLSFYETIDFEILELKLVGFNFIKSGGFQLIKFGKRRKRTIHLLGKKKEGISILTNLIIICFNLEIKTNTVRK